MPFVNEIADAVAGGMLRGSLPGGVNINGKTMFQFAPHGKRTGTQPYLAFTNFTLHSDETYPFITFDVQVETDEAVHQGMYIELSEGGWSVEYANPRTEELIESQVASDLFRDFPREHFLRWVAQVVASLPEALSLIAASEQYANTTFRNPAWVSGPELSDSYQNEMLKFFPKPFGEGGDLAGVVARAESLIEELKEKYLPSIYELRQEFEVALPYIDIIVRTPKAAFQISELLRERTEPYADRDEIVGFASFTQPGGVQYRCRVYAHHIR